ncbi:MAG: 4Fe-4S binding protein [Desulfuromonas sp.]|nr:4Fe-4S binding protein [Desulfuromonas sp.]
MPVSNLIIIDQERCTGCGWCLASCAQHAITLHTSRPDGFGDKRACIDQQRCTSCAQCLNSCPHHAISVHTMPYSNEAH